MAEFDSISAKRLLLLRMTDKDAINMRKECKQVKGKEWLKWYRTLRSTIQVNLFQALTWILAKCSHSLIFNKHRKKYTPLIWISFKTLSTLSWRNAHHSMIALSCQSRYSKRLLTATYFPYDLRNHHYVDGMVPIIPKSSKSSWAV